MKKNTLPVKIEAHSFTLLIVLYILAALNDNLEVIDTSIDFLIKISLSCFFIIFMFNKIISGKVKLVNIKLVLIIFVFVLINALFIREKMLLGVFLALFVGVSIGHILGTSVKITNLILLPFVILAIYIVYRLTIDSNPNNVFFFKSRNYISFYLLITVLPYYFVGVRLGKKISIIPALITFLLSLFALGRAGIITTFILFTGITIYKTSGRLKKGIIVGSIFILVFFLMSFFIESLDNASYYKITRLDNYLILEGRITLWENYFNKLNINSFLFGMKITLSNLNASFITGHVHSSILHFLTVVGFGAYIFLYYLIRKCKFYFHNYKIILILVIVLYMRIFVDTGCLFDYFDYVIWMFFFFEVDPSSKVNSEITVVNDR